MPPDTGQASLHEKIRRRSAGVCLYGLAPPKLATEPGRLAEIVAQQRARLTSLAPDGVIVYDIQDESARTAEARPFPFLPTIDPDVYARSHLAGVDAPKIVYRCVRNDSAASFAAWLDAVALGPSPRFSVLVGGASAQDGAAGLELSEAYRIARQRCPSLIVGGIAIAERHARRGDEHARLLNKIEQGCQFFVTQAVYDASATKSMLSDYALGLEAGRQPPASVVMTFSPCGSTRTLELMKWLGISFPRWLENELRHGADNILERSLRLCEQLFAEVWDYAREKKLPIGINVESVSIRKDEVEASVELFRLLRSRMQAGSTLEAPAAPTQTAAAHVADRQSTGSH
jgi:hypothetical protein